MTTADIRRMNLKKWIDDHHEGKQAALIEKTGINQGELSGLLKNKSFGEKKARSLEALAGMPSMWLDTPQTPAKAKESNVGDIGRHHLWSQNDPLPEEDYVFLPFYKDIVLAAGDGCFEMSDHNGFKLPFAKSTLRRNNVQYDQAVCVTVSGNSMEPVLPDQTTVSVNMADKRIVDGKIYAINQGGLLRVKRLYVLPNRKIRINSYNNEEHADDIEPIEDVEIIGRVFNWSVMDI